jgi:hypothetical protein
MRKHGSLYHALALQHSHNNGLAFSSLHSAIPTHALTLLSVHVSGFTADESFIDFNGRTGATKLGERAALQCEAKPMQHEPSGLLSNSDSLADFVAGDSVLAVNQHPQSGKPLIQTKRGIFKDGAKFYGELLVALFALPAFLSLEVVVLFVSASRALRAIGPADRGYGVDADLLVGKVPNGLLESLWLGVHELTLAN